MKWREEQFSLMEEVNVSGHGGRAYLLMMKQRERSRHDEEEKRASPMMKQREEALQETLVLAIQFLNIKNWIQTS